MIERSEVDGRPATLFWIMDDFDPADRDDATLCKVVYDDGDVAFVAVNVDEDEPAEDEFNEADHPRGQPGNAGEFGPGGGSKKKTENSFKTYANGRRDLGDLTDAVQSGELNDGLGDAQEKRWVLAGYSGSTASWDINHALRSGEKLPPVRQRTVDALDIAMKESSLSENLAVWRALAYKSELSPEVKKLMDGLKPGDTFVDKGFVSTSAIQHRPNAEVMKILAPKGSKALIANGTFIGYDGENEVVLDRGGRYEYVGDEGGSKVFRLHQGTEIAGDDASWNESAHPRGQPENAGEFASAPGGGSKKKSDEDEPLLTVGAPAKSWAKPGAIPNADGGHRMPDVVYRGAGPENEERSGMAEGKGVYVSAFPEIAAQWGQPKKYKVKKQPLLIDLGDFDSDPSKRLVGAWLGKGAKRVTKEEFDEVAPELFIQNNGVDIVKQMNFDGYRLGGDIFLRGKLSDYVEPGVAMKTKPDIRKSMNKVTEVAASTQPVKSLDELYERARAEEPAFRKMVEDIAEVTGSKPKFGEKDGSILKTRESSERKLRDELGGDFTKLRDVLRGTVVGDSVEKTRDAAATFVAKQGDNVLRVKDRHVGPTSSGYRDILVNFRTPGGLVAELQFNSKAMTAAKEGQGHKLYDAIRGGALAGKSFDELQEAARAIYEKAYADDGDGHWEMK